MSRFQGSLRWGFLGAGKISSDFATVLGALPSNLHVSYGVAARDPSRAKVFQEAHKISKFFNSYQDLVKDPNIDVVYIGTVNSEHFYQAKLAIENCKHVLVEKPICTNLKQCQQLVNLAKQHGVFLMEGMWTAFFPATRHLFSQIDQGSIGDIVAVTLDLGRGEEFCNVDRFTRNDLSGGTLMNHGIYGCVLSYLLLGAPDKISATGFLSEEGVDTTVAVTMSYQKKQAISSVIMSSRSTLSSSLFVAGTKGSVRLPYPFWAPSQCETPTGLMTFDLPKLCENKSTNYGHSSGFKYQIDEVYRCISEGLQESPLMPWEASLGSMSIADEIRRQVGVVFPQD